MNLPQPTSAAFLVRSFWSDACAWQKYAEKARVSLRAAASADSDIVKASFIDLARFYAELARARLRIAASTLNEKGRI